jgi:GNAT superfamily N-acetyltransferase
MSQLKKLSDCVPWVRELDEQRHRNWMGQSLMPITVFETREASGEEFIALVAFRNRIRAEQLPDDPPIPASEYLLRMQNISPAMKSHVWVVWNAARTEVRASGGLDFNVNGENHESANVRIAVLPEFRRRGIGCRLLALIAQLAQGENRRLLFAHTSRIEAGHKFITDLGATKSLDSHIDQLTLSDLDAALVKGWLENAGARVHEFELLFWSGTYPEEEIKAIAELHNVINHQPRGDLEIEDIDFTPEHVRVIEYRAFSNGAKRWSMCAREKATGKFAGFTQVYWHPNRPALVQQSFTGVFPEFRNRGLGRWLKLAMLEKLMRERPEVKFIRTDNANSNAAIRRVNALLGFKPYSSNCLWQIETDKIIKGLMRIEDERRTDPTSGAAFDACAFHQRTTQFP